MNSFIAALGPGTVLYVIALWRTGGKQMIGALPAGFLSINARFVLGTPVTALYVPLLAIALIIWSRSGRRSGVNSIRSGQARKALLSTGFRSANT